MKKSFLILAIAAFAISCQNKTNTTDSVNTDQKDTLTNQTEFIDKEHTSQISLDWNGTYKATLPCADCPGIETVVSLFTDNTFKISSHYIDREVVVEDAGEIMWHDNGNQIHLKGKDTDLQFRVIENGIIQLDTNGNEIEGSLKEFYTFQKLEE